MSILCIENLSLKTNGNSRLFNIDLKIEPGEIYCIIGKSGSGKTTLGRVIAGLETQFSGSVVLGSPDDDLPVDVSFALSTPAQAPELTVYENLDMFGSLLDIKKKARTGEIAFLLELLKLSDFRHSRVSTLSSGFKARLEIARALLADVPLLIIDSLLDSLDADVLEKLWDYLLSLRRGGQRSILIFTSSAQIAEMCDKLAVIHNGKIVYAGKPDDLRSLAGEDLLVLGNVKDALIKKRIKEQFSLIISEEEGFLSFKINNGQEMVGELLSEFGAELGCVYLKRPTLQDALGVVSNQTSYVIAANPQGKVTE